MTTYFAYHTAAKRYARSRPYTHPWVIEKIGDFLRLPGPVARALDVGCGTGQSSVALKSIAREIVGTDLSSEMLAEAPPDPAIRYLQAPAEDLPLPDESFDLLTVSSAFHWFDRSRFLAEARRVLRVSGWLVIYKNGFYGRMRENPAFKGWSDGAYVDHYPIPPRNTQAFGAEDAAQGGFHLVRQEKYTNDVRFTADQLADYLMTQSNVIAAVERGTETAAGVRSWLMGEFVPLFSVPVGAFAFGGSILYCQKI